MTVVDRAVSALFERLMGNPYRGTLQGLADELGIPRLTLVVAIQRTRDPEWIAEYGWTIPYVTPGANWNEYRIVDAEQMAADEVMHGSQDQRAASMLRAVRRNLGQAALARASQDGRSRSGRQWDSVIKGLTGVEGMLQMLLFGEGEE